MNFRTKISIFLFVICSIQFSYAEACKQFGESLVFGGTCCQDLVPNPHTLKCDMPVISDPTMTSCTNDSNCSGGTGCYPQRGTDLFSNLSAVEDEQSLEEGATLMDAQIETLEDEDPRPLGAACVHPRQCESYSCSSDKKCVEVKVCRFADVDEFAPGDVKCGKDLIKTPANICKPDPSVMPEDDDTVEFEQGPSCQFNIKKETAEKAQRAMKSLRAMEWLFATNDFTNEESCLGINDIMKNEVALPLSNKRKELLGSFSTVLKGIETDFQTLVTAKELGNQVVTVHLDETLPASALATRQTSGYDSLVMLLRRNVLFQDYESQMMNQLSDASIKVSGLATEMAKWKEKDQSWNLGTRTMGYRPCKPNWEYWFLKWKPFKLKKTKNRVANIYVVKGTAQNNRAAITKSEVANHIKLIYRDSNALASFVGSPNYYLLDPIMRKSPLDFGDFGWETKIDDILLKIFVTPFFRVKKDPLNLTGNKQHHLSAIYDRTGPHIKDYIKNLKTNSDQKDFVYDPELVNSSAKDCLDPNNTNNADCDLYTAYLKELQDEAFAQWFAFSAHKKSKYKSYFNKQNTGRIKLLEKYASDLSLMVNYYNEVLKQREIQNECIERVIHGLDDSGILGSNGGLEEGNYYDPSTGTPGAGSSTPGSGSASAVRNKLTRTKFSFNLAGGMNSSNGGKTNLDKVDKSGTQSQSANVRQSALALLAARKENIKKANASASSNGVNVGDRQKDYKEIVESVNKQSKLGTLGSVASTGAGNGSGISSFGGNKSISVGSGEGSKAQDDADNSKKDLMTSIPQATIDMNQNQGYGGNSISETTQEGETQNPEGLSDSDRERMLSEYERNKKDYKSSEEDDLFGKVSKAYVRNLDKVLKKKKIEK